MGNGATARPGLALRPPALPSAARVPLKQSLGRQDDHLQPQVQKQLLLTKRPPPLPFYPTDSEWLRLSIRLRDTLAAGADQITPFLLTAGFDGEEGEGVEKEKGCWTGDDRCLCSLRQPLSMTVEVQGVERVAEGPAGPRPSRGDVPPQPSSSPPVLPHTGPCQVGDYA